MRGLALLLLTALPLLAQTPGWRERTLEWVAEHRRDDGWYGLPHVSWSDARLTGHALAIRELLSDPHEEADRLQRTLASRAAEARRAPERLALARLIERHGWQRPAALQPVRPWMVAPMDWDASPPLSELADRIELLGHFGEAPDTRIVDAWLALWEAPDGGWHHPLAEDEALDRIARGDFLFIAPPTRTDAPSPIAITVAAVRIRAGRLDPERRARLLKRLDDAWKPASVGEGIAPGLPADAAPTLRDTALAARALERIGAAFDRARCRSFVMTHRVASGGFASRPGHVADLESTHDALWLLGAAGLAAMKELPFTRKPTPERQRRLPLRQAILEIGPDPGVALVLAARAGAHLVLLKDTRPEVDEGELVARARALKRDLGLSQIRVAAARERHKTGFLESGSGYFTHAGEWIFDPLLRTPDFGPDRPRTDRAGWQRMTRGRGDSAPIHFTSAFRPRHLLEPFLIDRERRVHDAIVLTWALAEQGDLVRRAPWLAAASHRMAPLGNHDAHGDPLHWAHRGFRARTLFFAKDASFEAFASAIRAGRTVAVAHGARTELYGETRLRERARRAIRSWDRGRDRRHPEPWLPDPIALPIHASTIRELGFDPGGPAILVRAGHRIGDEAFPDEIVLRVGDRRLRLEMAPAGAREIPFAWARVPDDLLIENCSVPVLVEAHGRLDRQELYLRAWKDAPRPTLAPLAPRPLQLTFDTRAEIAHVRGTLGPGDLQGTLRLATARTDLLLARGTNDAIQIRHQGGAQTGAAEIFWDGVRIGRLDPTQDPVMRRFALPPARPGSPDAHTLSFRTGLPGWQPSFPRPQSDLVLHEVRLVTE